LIGFYTNLINELLKGLLQFIYKLAYSIYRFRDDQILFYFSMYEFNKCDKGLIVFNAAKSVSLPWRSRVCICGSTLTGSIRLISVLGVIHELWILFSSFFTALSAIIILFSSVQVVCKYFLCVPHILSFILPIFLL